MVKVKMRPLPGGNNHKSVEDYDFCVGDKIWFANVEVGEHCEIISIREHSIVINWSHRHVPEIMLFRNIPKIREMRIAL